MTRPVWATWIGAFVVVGLILFAFTVFWYFPARQYVFTRPYVIYFHGSVDGLRQGAEVEYRGIRVGKVADILLNYNPKKNDFDVSVIVYFLRRIVNQKGMPQMKTLIQRGLKARLQRQSIISPAKFVELYKDNNKPYYAVNKTPYIQIPTGKNDGEGTGPFNTVVGNLNATLVSLNDILSGPTKVHFHDTLKELREASYSLRVLMDYLARHPESLIRGKRGR